MARFFVGQRVRLARPVNPENLGAEGHIRHIFHEIPGKQLPFVNCVCDWERPVIGRVSHTSQLEPITPEGHQPARWEDCAWQPDHLRERVA